MPRSAVTSAALVLAAVAALGVYLGLGRAVPGFVDTGGQTYVVARAQGAGRTVMAEPPPPLPALDETAIRKIAREEAEAALSHGRPPPRRSAPSASSSDTDAGDDTQAADPAEAAAAPVRSPTPVPTSPAPPAAGPPDL